MHTTFCSLLMLVTFHIAQVTVIQAEEPARPGTDSTAPVLGEIELIDDIETIVAVKDVCAWPNLTLMPDGSIAALLFNKPSHGKEEGDVVCYVSEDDGKSWEFRGTPVEHEPGTVRMNHAAGLAHDGALVAVVSGWGGEDFRRYILEPKVSRSYDGGITWEVEGSVTIPEGEDQIIPFGDIISVDENTLAFTGYGWLDRKSNPAYVFFSHDDGRTWDEHYPIGVYGDNPGAGTYNPYNETAILNLDGSHMLAAPRTLTGASQLMISDDNGKTWNAPASLRGTTLLRVYEHPCHLFRLDDGRVLLTYGVRWGYHGTCTRVSDDGGMTWSAPMMVTYYGGTDGGYPASVQTADGTIVTAYYCKGGPYYDGYYMGIVRWRLPE